MMVKLLMGFALLCLFACASQPKQGDSKKEAEKAFEELDSK